MCWYGFLTRLIVFSILIMFASGLIAQLQPDTLSIDDILSMDEITHLRISANGHYLLYINQQFSETTHLREGHLYFMAWESQDEPLLIAPADWDVVQAEFSPTEKEFIIARKIEDKTEFYRYRIPFGGLEKVLSLETPFYKFAWAGMDDLIILGAENKRQTELLKKTGDDAIVFEDSLTFFPHHLYRFNLTKKKTVRLTDLHEKIQEFAVAPASPQIIMKCFDSPRYGNDLSVFPHYYLLNYQTLAIDTLFRETTFQPYRFQWSFTSPVLYFLEDSSNFESKQGRGLTRIFQFDIVSRQPRQIALNHPWGIGENYYTPYALNRNGILTFLADGALNRACWIQAGKAQRLKGEPADHLEMIDLAERGNLVLYITSTAQDLPCLYVGRIDGSMIKPLKPVYHLHPSLKGKKLAKREIVRWQSEQGRTIEGILYYPTDYRTGQKYPLLLNIHGGPFGVDLDRFTQDWAYYPHYLAQRQTFALFINYTGSSNYGLEFAEAIYNKYYELEIPDMMSGIDTLINRGLVDPQQVGTMGWSNGSILSIGLIVEYPSRFTVACCGAGDVNWISDYGNCSIGVSFDQLYFGGAPWDNLDHYIAKSPLFNMERVITPTIIFFGDDDINVPPEQGVEHYRALQQIGKAPVRFIQFPGEPHSFQNKIHQKRKMQEEIGWLDRYFWKNEIQGDLPGWVSVNLPLANLVKKTREIKQTHGKYGVLDHDILTPQMKVVDSLTVSVFEITVAQWNEFAARSEGKYSLLAVDSPNRPATGINDMMAIDYCRWLSRITSKTYSLPNAAIYEKLFAQANPSNENTLAYWLGGAPNPLEKKELSPYIGQLDLVKNVGEFAPTPDGIYDLQVNVSEWGYDKAGQLVLWGQHAQSTGEAGLWWEWRAPAGYCGFRVVLTPEE